MAFATSSSRDKRIPTTPSDVPGGIQIAMKSRLSPIARPASDCASQAVKRVQTGTVSR